MRSHSRRTPLKVVAGHSASDAAPVEVTIAWPAAPAPTSISASMVQVWAAPLDVAPARLARLARLLHADERKRAARFHGATLSQRFVAGRGLLREVLAAYLDMDAADIRFAYDAYGKPELADPVGPPLRFNVAHSAGLILVAVSRGARLGVDVEAVLRFDDMEGVAGRFFSPRERGRLANLPVADHVAAFYRCWTRKEAYLKAVGTGLSTPLDSFDVSVSLDESALLYDTGDARAPSRWSIVHLEPAREFIGAIALEHPSPSVDCWRWLSNEC